MTDHNRQQAQSQRKRQPHRHLAYPRWISQFLKLSCESPDCSRVLHRWAFNGVLHETVAWLLYFYVAEAPSQSYVRERLKSATGDLANQMNKLSSALTAFDTSSTGREFRRALRELDTALGPLPGGKLRLLTERYSELPKFLSQLALVLNVVTLQRGVFSPAQRKLAQTRALAMLYLHFRAAFKDSDYRIASDLAAVLNVAKLAAGADEDQDVGHDVVKNRISRFRKEHPREFSGLRDIIIGPHGLPQDPAILGRLLVMPDFRPE